MKALLLKDFYVIMKYCRSVFLIAIIFWMLATLDVDMNNTFFIIYPILLISMLPHTLIAYDERARWDIYSMTFPWSRKQLVTERYLLAAIMLGVAWLLSLLVLTIHAMISSDWSVLSYLPVLFSFGLFTPSLVLPFVYKFGTEKARLIYYFVIGLVTAVTVIIGLVSTNSVDIGSFSFGNLPANLLFTAIVIVSILLFAGSWQLSIRIYRKREL